MADMNDEGRMWYVVNTYSGHENKVKDNLEKRIESMGLQDLVFNILIPTHIETEIKDGKKVNKEKNIWPGYVLVEMIMTDEAWYVVRNTPGVTGFIGSSGGGAGKTGKVDSIDKEKETGVVLVEFFGNLTPVDTDLISMEKVEV